jgi:Xaa-Pro aminopeptidase
MPEVHARRRVEAWRQAQLAAPSATALLVTSLANVRYLTGFTGSNAVLLLEDSSSLLGTDGRYTVQAAEQCPDLPVHLDRATLTSVAAAWAASGVGVLAVESAHLSVSDLRALEEAIGSSPQETTGVVEACRMLKDADEIALIERACEISDAALQAILPRIHAGLTERQIARWLEAEMFDQGADELSFETIVAGGPHSAKPHHEPSERALEDGDLLLIDFGAAVGGYHADETRTFVVGKPAEWQREIHAIVQRAQEAGRAAARSGASLMDVDAAARSVVADAGFGAHFDHGLGHGVGLEIHEAPFFSQRSTGMLPAGSPVTIEPGIYLPGRGGVRIEDTILVGEGPSRSLTASPRDLVVLG